MRVNLFIKYFVCYICIVVVSLFILNTVGVSYLKNDALLKIKEAMRLQSEKIVSSYMKEYYNGTLSIYNVYEILKNIGNFINARILIVNANNEIISDTDRLQNYTEQRERIPDWFLEEDSYVGRVEFSKSEIVSIIQPIDIDFSLKGYIVIATDIQLIKNNALDNIEMLNICFLILDIVFLFALLLLYFITIIPLREVIKAAREYARGNFEYKLSIGRNRTDEFIDLIDTIEYMANELRLTEEYQRRLISNISHDFRSPLTSIRGYATAMIDGTIPTELYNKYLNIICFETDRLTKLTSGLIELGQFDCHQIMLNIQKIELNNIIKRTTESFEGRCREKKISISLTFANETSYVFVDKTKIEQVFYNLIDNAIKFSENNSEIHIETIEKTSKIIVSIKDHGVGIPKEAINKIWERFYKSDSSRGKDKRGSGLGLSIVKEIIQAHGEEIDVISTFGAGTEFIFTLSKVEVLYA